MKKKIAKSTTILSTRVVKKSIPRHAFITWHIIPSSDTYMSLHTCHPPAIFLIFLSLPTLRKGTMATATETRGCLTCQRSASISTARLLPSHTRPARTSSPRTSRPPISPSPTRSPRIPTPTSATPSTSTLCSRRHRTSSSRGPAGRARKGSAPMGGAVWRVRSLAWREVRPGWGGKAFDGRSCCPLTAWSRRLLGTV